jgi:O-antigen/teichoic acid export membrane protein
VFCSRDEVALYGAAWRLAQVVALPIAIANAVIPPLIAELHAGKQKAELERLLRRSASWGGIPATVACLLAVIAGGGILSLVYGQFYRAAALPLALLSIGQAANVLAGSSGFALMMTGNEKTMLATTFASGAFFFMGELLATPRLGTGGAAGVAAGAMILQNVLMLLFVRKRLGIWTHAEFGLCLRQAPAASAMSAE